jgi:hypothetical protein
VHPEESLETNSIQTLRTIPENSGRFWIIPENSGFSRKIPDNSGCIRVEGAFVTIRHDQVCSPDE